jgi:hypothetical protein
MGATPLHYACSTSDCMIIERLLQRNGNVNAATHTGWTPLHIAAVKGDTSVIQFLLSNKADPTLKTVENKLPSDLAKNRKAKKLLSFDSSRNENKPRFLSLTMDTVRTTPVPIPTRAESVQTFEFNTTTHNTVPVTSSGLFREQITSLMRQNAQLTNDLLLIRKELNASKWFIPWNNLALESSICQESESNVYLASWKFTQVALKKIPLHNKSELSILQ